ncbi:PQ-loop repeat-containing protein [Bacillus inaquosorum]|uniref:PQ-loop repeat-containing protein n=1 Tax=Bacillus inaquosorum TaxID=483913 RepID=UPI0022822004|nr:PQ-loop repeat-containing protein [Bacillus inaquosorum]MCY9308810.1 PQ-loop repeat-containing protein [Bacillus inaquosorum]
MLDFLIALLPNIATVLLAICYAPQIWKTAKTKNVEGMAIWFWVLLITALTLFLIYNILLFIKFGVYMGVITEGVNVGLAIVVLIQVILYRDKKGNIEG